MKRLPVIAILLLASFFTRGQDTVLYRSTGFHAAVSDFVLLGAKYPQYGVLFPAATVSIKSSRADSAFNTTRAWNFSIMAGLAVSRYLFFDEKFFVNFLDKSPFHVLSKRFWGGFGVNYRKAISDRFLIDADIAPCLQVNVDKSEESKTDTSGWDSFTYENIYQGLHLNAFVKLEYRTRGSLAPFVSLSGAVPLVHNIARDPGDEPYHNLFKGQFFIGAGVSWYYRSRHLSERGEKNKSAK